LRFGIDSLCRASAVDSTASQVSAGRAMTEREALYRAIMESPEDDAPRLVYADWLEEHGEPKRAEFIRLQCELSSIIMGTQAAFARYAAIQKRCWALFRANQLRWSREFGPMPTLNIWYRRGMAAKVVCSVEYFLAHGSRLFDVAPIDEVEFTQIEPRHLRLLTACPCSRRVRRFRFLSAEDNDQVVRAILAQWPFPELRVLELRVLTPGALVPQQVFWRAETPDPPSGAWHQRWAGVTTAIARSECLRVLRRLSLARCGIGNAGGQALADSPHLENLAVLDLTDNPLSRAVRYRLLERFEWRVIFDYRDHSGFRAGDLFG
jgi:uncharacterized protein (TIGR02996 family)